MVAAPAVLANCVKVPAPMLKVRLPSTCPSTLTAGTLTAEPAGDASDPLALKTKFVPVLTHAVWAPVALVLVW